MARRRFKNVGSGSFFGQFLYERIVPRDHFLVKLNQLIDWDPFVELLVPAYKGLAEMGRPWIVTFFSNRCHPRGLTIRVAGLLPSRYCFPAGLSNEMVPRTASNRLT